MSAYKNPPKEVADLARRMVQYTRRMARKLHVIIDTLEDHRGETGVKADSDFHRVIGSLLRGADIDAKFAYAYCAGVNKSHTTSGRLPKYIEVIRKNGLLKDFGEIVDEIELALEWDYGELNYDEIYSNLKHTIDHEFIAIFQAFHYITIDGIPVHLENVPLYQSLIIYGQIR